MSQLKTYSESLTDLLAQRVMGVERQPKILKTADHEGDVVLSNDPDTASVPPAFFTVNSIQELKALGGVPDSLYGSNGMPDHHPLPAPFSAERLRNATGNHADLCTALRAYVYGNSALVQDYQDILNSKRFPMQVAVYTGDDIVVSPGHDLIVEDKDGHGDPVVLAYNSITVEPGGRIIYKTNGTVKASKMVVVANATPDYNFNNVGGNGGSGGSGSNGNNGAAGSDGNAGKDNKSSCAQAATNGTAGGGGTAGANGVAGGKGETANDVYLAVDQLDGKVVALTQGGNGGAGGNGGNGGAGGKGGNGGASTSQCSAGNGGAGGSGGKGGNAGAGGDGGNGGQIYITYSSGVPSIQAKAVGGQGGTGGRGGSGGAGGSGGSGKTAGSNGSVGGTGSSGTAGKAGASGKIYVNGVQIPA